MDTFESMLNALSEKLGIIPSFRDPATGIVCVADNESKKAICAALGYPADTLDLIQKSLDRFDKEKWQSIVMPTIAVFQRELQPLIFEMCLPLYATETPIDFELIQENGTFSTGSFRFTDMPVIEERVLENEKWQKRRVYLYLEATEGYHRLVLKQENQEVAHAYLIVAPERCYMPSFAQTQARVFGFPLQLYALKSEQNWGIGDFSDLSRMVSIAKKLGAALIGVNPLSALFPDSPCDASPYCASSRLFLNPLYVDLDALPEAKTSAEYRRLKESKSFQTTLQKLRKSEQVQYEIVAQLKEKSFKVLHKEFLLTNFDKNKKSISKRGKKYQRFCQEKGRTLENFAAYQVLRQWHLTHQKSAIWHAWDSSLQQPESIAVREFCQAHREEIDLIYFQQFVAFEQYEKVIQTIQKAGMSIGLYTDLPVGVSANSAEVWSNQDLFMPHVTTGAPPDEFNKKGQDWSLAPFNPYRLAQTGFQAYRKIINQSMQGAGAVRLDHAFGLERLYLRVPHASGAYLKYPYKILMAVIALESHRNQCVVIAEDLGTPPDGFSDKMRQAQALSFKIAHFQQWNGTLIDPQQYDYLSLVATGTHDMASYTAFWKEIDLELARSMKTITEEQYQLHKENRAHDKKSFLSAFQQHNLNLPVSDISEITDSSVPHWFIENIYTYLARARSMILLVRFEDLLGQDEQVNLPGTYLEYPNWRYKLPLEIEKLMRYPAVQKVCRLIEKERPLFQSNEGEND